MATFVHSHKSYNKHLVVVKMVKETDSNDGNTDGVGDSSSSDGNGGGWWYW